jgi:large subunit ribosomal protein L21
MYAIIRAGGKQAKVQSGDVIEIERLKGDAEQITFAPLLVVDDKGNAVSDRDVLSKATVTARILGESQGPKIDIFKYKNKTGNRRHQEPAAKPTAEPAKKPAAKTTAKAADKSETKPAAKPAAKKPAAKPAARPAKSATSEEE